MDLLDDDSTHLRPVYDQVRLLLKSAADAQASSQPVASTPFGKAAAQLQIALAQGDQAKRFSREASEQSSSRIPKSKRPVFEPPNDEKEAAIQALLAAYPTASVGSSRKTIEIYDPNGSQEDWEAILYSPEMRCLMQPHKRWSISQTIVPEDDIEDFVEKLPEADKFTVEMAKVMAPWMFDLPVGGDAAMSRIEALRDAVARGDIKSPFS